MNDNVQEDIAPAFHAIFIMICSLSSWVTSVIGVLSNVLELAVLVGNVVVLFFTARYLSRKTKRLDKTTLKNSSDGIDE